MLVTEPVMHSRSQTQLLPRVPSAGGPAASGRASPLLFLLTLHLQYAHCVPSLAVILRCVSVHFTSLLRSGAP